MIRVIVVGEGLGTEDLAQPLREARDIKVVATFSGIAEALRLLSKTLSGVDAFAVYAPARPDSLGPLREIIQRYPRTGTLVLTDQPDVAFVEELVRMGAQGCLPTDSDNESLLLALRLVAEGSASLDPDVVRKLVQERAAAPRAGRSR
jgi:DNA-binding NarL/FixJ family response regulator